MCTCPDGYYDDNTNLECVKCANGCATCSDNTKCDTCKHSINPSRTDENNFCVCPQYYYDNGVDG